MFAEVVRTNRQRLGLTQEELAASAGLGVRTIRKIEAGRVGVPRPATVRLLADAFGLIGADRDGFCQIAAGEPTDPRTSSRAPAQLPADVSAFTGRAEQLAQLDTLLTPAPDHANAVIISALSGTAGVGKTALAVHWAHRVRDRFSDGQLYVDLRGYDPDQPTTSADALTRLLSALGITAQDIPQELDEMAARYRSELADRQMLILLDNVAGVEQVRPLLPGSGSTIVVVTSRDSLAGLVAVNGAYRIDLDLLQPAEAMTLLRRLIGPRVDAAPEATATMASQCARLPLALRIVAELAVSRPSAPIEELVAALADQQRRLELLDAGGDPHAAVKAVFSWSIQYLPTDAAAILRLLGLHPGPDADPYAVAALADTSFEDARRGLDILARAHLVQPTGPGRYGMHDLLRAYAAELARIHVTDQTRHVALSRQLDYYRYTAAIAMDVAYPHEHQRRPRVLRAATPSPGWTETTEVDAWLDVELPNLLAVARFALVNGWPEHVLDLSTILYRHLRNLGRHHDAETLHHQALAAARATGRLTGEPYALTGLGWVCRMRGQYAQATDYYQQAVQVARSAGDPYGQLDALTGLGWVCRMQGRYAQAIDYDQQAVQIARSGGDRTGEINALIGLGHIHRLQGRYAQATDHYQQALQVACIVGDRTGELSAWIGLGQVGVRQGHYAQATDHYQRALLIARSTSNPNGEVNVLTGLGHVHRLQGRCAQATDHYQRALLIARSTSNPNGELNALTGLGQAGRIQGRYAQATDHYRQLLALARKTGERNFEFEAWQGLGRLRHITGDPEAAINHHNQALALADELSQPDDQARAHDGLGHAHHALNHYRQARRHWQHALTILTRLDIRRTDDKETTPTAIRAHLATLAERTASAPGTSR